MSFLDDLKYAAQGLIENTKDFIGKGNELSNELANDFNKDKGFWNDLNDVVANVSAYIPGLQDYAKQTVAENFVEDLQKQNSELSEETIKKNKYQIEGLRNIVGNEYVDEVLNKEIRQVKTKENTYKELESTIGKDIKEAISKGYLDNNKGTQLFQTIYKDIYDINLLTNNLKQKEGSYANISNDFVNKIHHLKKKYLETLGKKIKEYNGDVDKIANDDELYNIRKLITTGIETTKVISQTNDLVNTNITDSPILFGKKFAQATLGTIVGLGKLGEIAISDVYNKTIGKATDSHIELQGGAQKEIDQVGANTAYKIVDNVGNFIDSIAPYVTGLGISTIKGGNIVNKLTKNGGIINKTIKAAGANELINALFNNAYEPILSKSTANRDLIIDGLSALFLTPVLGAIGKGISYGLEKEAIKKYGDTAVEIVKKDGTKEKIKLSDLVSDPHKLENLIDNVTTAKGLLDIAKLEKLFGDSIIKMDNLVNKKSSLISAPLVRKYKKSVIDGMIKGFKDAGKLNEAKALEKLTTTSKGIDEVFNSLYKSFIEFKDKLDKVAKTEKDINRLRAIQGQIGNLFIENIGKSLSDTGKINPANIKIPTKEELELQYFADNINVGDNLMQGLNKSVDVIVNKFKGKKIQTKKFIDELLNVINENFKGVSLSKKDKKIFDNIINGLNKFKDTKGHIKLAENTKEIGQTYKGVITISALKDLYKNPVDFYIVLFHELTHLTGGVNMFKKIVGDKTYNRFKDLYDKLKVGVSKMKALPGIDGAMLEKLNNIERTVLENEDEFFTYMLGEILVKGQSDVARKMVNLLYNMGLSVNYPQFIAALKKYISNRFKDIKDSGDIIQKIQKIGDVTMKSRKVFNSLFGDFLKTGHYDYLYKVIDDTDTDLLLKHIYTDDAIKYIKGLGLDDKTIKDVIKYQIMMGVEGKKGFQAGLLWRYIGDLIDEGNSNIEYIVKDIFKDKIGKIKKIILGGGKISGKVTDTIDGIINSMLKTNTLDSVTKVNLASLIFKYGVEGFGLKKSQKDLIGTLIDLYKKEYGIINTYKDKYYEFIKGLGLDIKKGVSQNELKSIFEKGNYLLLDKLIRDSKIDLGDNIITEDKIRYLYNRFDHNIVHTILKRQLKGDKYLSELNDKIYKNRETLLQELKKKGINPAKKIVGGANNLGAYLFEKQGKKVIVQAEDGKTYIYEGGTIKEGGYNQIQKIIEEGFSFDRIGKIENEIDDIFTKGKDTILIYKTKLKQCL